MIPNDAELLSIDTMPYFIKLISLYNKSVEDLTAIFRVQKDEAAFSKLLDYLVNDFEYYQATYENWQQEAKTEADRCSLEVLKPLLEEAKRLLTEAVSLIKH